MKEKINYSLLLGKWAEECAGFLRNLNCPTTFLSSSPPAMIKASSRRPQFKKG
jgi:hypothetical protein